MHELNFKGLRYALILYIKVTKDTIVNCREKSGLIDCNETREEVENLLEKEKIKYITEIDEELKVIGRESFFKQFIILVFCKIYDISEIDPD